jgi:predicted phosphodiesterase
MRTLILSDIHLGLPGVAGLRPRRSAATLEPLLWGFSAVILNGDTADIHQPRCAPDAQRLLNELRESARRAKVEVVEVCGNHDVAETSRTHALLAGGSVLVSHGHAFSARMLPWVSATGEMNRRFAEALAHNPDTIEGAVRAANEGALVQWSDEHAADEPTALWSIGRSPARVLSVLRWWREYPRDAARFADRYSPQAKVVICGHSHRAGAWRIASAHGAPVRLILNTGSFSFPGRPFGAIVDEQEGTVELRRIHARQGRYELAPRSDANCWRIH